MFSGFACAFGPAGRPCGQSLRSLPPSPHIPTARRIFLRRAAFVAATQKAPSAAGTIGESVYFCFLRNLRRLEQVYIGRPVKMLERECPMQAKDKYFSQVYGQCYKPLLRYAFLKLSDPHEAEDALQSAFTRFYRRISLRGYRDIEDAKAFALTLLKHELAERYARRARREEHEAPLPEVELPSEDEELAVRVETAQEAARILDYAKALPAESYRTFVLYYGFDMCVEDIAEALGAGPEAIKSRLFRARKAIRERLMEGEKG